MRSIFVVAVTIALAGGGHALAQLLVNGGFDEGFSTDRVALGWAYELAPAYPGDFDIGTDYVHDGAYSQKMRMAQPVWPIENGDLLMWQTFYAVPGQVYTVSLWLRTAQGGESLPGTLLNCFLGLDPTGGTYRYSEDIQWHELSNQRNVWKLESRTVMAQGPYVTIYLRGYRKVPTGGAGAIWLDSVTVSGPLNGSPTPTVTPSITPTATIPPPNGPNLVTNGDFENGFDARGVALGWQAWTSVGRGYWKPTSRLGKVGIGNYGNSTGWYTAMLEIRPKTVLLCQTFGAADLIAAERSLDDTLVVGRQVIDDRYGDIEAGRIDAVVNDLVNLYWREHLLHPRIDAWLGLNEPGWSALHWAKYVEFERRFTEAMHARGLKTVVFNFGVGSPGDTTRLLDCQPALQIADYLGYHTYGCPAPDEYLVTNIRYHNPYDYALRGERMAALLESRGHRLPPMLYTENAPHAGPGGWHDHLPNALVRDDFIAFQGYMNRQPWCVGSHIWVCGWFGSWEGYDIANRGIAAPVGQANQQAPADVTSGVSAQQFGAGILHATTAAVPTPQGVFTGGLVQHMSGFLPGEAYLLLVDTKYEFNWGRPAVSFRTGIDWTGQVSSGSAPTILWSDDLFSVPRTTHERFYRQRRFLVAQAPTASLWIGASQDSTAPSWRVTVDAVSLYRVGGTPMPTDTPPPVATATPTVTRTFTPWATVGLTVPNGGFEGEFIWDAFPDQMRPADWSCGTASGGWNDVPQPPRPPRYKVETNWNARSGSRCFNMKELNQVGGRYTVYSAPVAVPPGTEITARAWFLNFATGSPAECICRIGVHPTGGTDAESVVWGDAKSVKNAYTELLASVVAAADTVRVFLRAEPETVPIVNLLWDDVTAIAAPVVATPTVSPTPTLPTVSYPVLGVR